MAAVDILLITQIVCAVFYCLYLLYLYYSKRTAIENSREAKAVDAKSARVAASLRICPITCVILSLIAVIFKVKDAERRIDECPEDDFEINPDIGGIGVLLGLFLPCLVLLLVLVSGHFKAETSGAKELCMAQCASMYSKDGSIFIR